MKNSFGLAFLMILIVIISSCRRDDSVSEEEQKRELITNIWEVQSAVNNDTQDPIALSQPIRVEFSRENFEVISGSVDQLPNKNNALFPSGSWRFENADLNSLVISNGDIETVLNIVSLTANEFTFVYEGAEPKATNRFDTRVTLGEFSN